MKIDNMFIISLILLAILSIGVVSASDNLALNENNSLSVIEEDDDFDYDDLDDWQDDDAYQMDVNVEDNFVYYEDDISLVNLTLPADAKGNLEVYERDYEDNDVYLSEFPLTKGHVEVMLSQLPFDEDCLFGFHDLIFIYDGDDYRVMDDRCFITLVDYELSGSKYINFGQTAAYHFDLNREGAGKVRVESSFEDGSGNTIDGDKFYFDVVDGVADIQFSDLNMGTHYFYFEFEDEIISIQREITLYVLPKVNTKDKIVIGVDNILDVDLPDDAEGTFLLSLYSYDLDDYIDLTADYSDGKIRFSSIGLVAGDYDISDFEIDDLYYGSISFGQIPMSESKQGIFTTFKAVYPTGVAVTASNFNTVYSSGGIYKVKVTLNGKAAKGAIVVFKINGVEVKTTKVDKNGYASLKITKAPGTYKITTVVLGKTVTKTLTVKHLLTLSKVAVKKSKNLVLTASLAKVNGKYLAKKQIKFKFNGITYTKTTDSKGIAKITIPKSALSKLKQGKSITYQATYSADTVKQTVKISK